MIGFATSSVIRDLPKAEIIAHSLPEIWHGEFTANLVCVSEIAGTFTIPKGFITDGASIPHLLWASLSDTDPDILYPAYAHDFLYSVHGKLPDLTLDRDHVDNILREQMLAIYTPRWKADVCYRMVHMFGGGSFNKKLGLTRQPWKAVTPPHKLAHTVYAMHPRVRHP